MKKKIVCHYRKYTIKLMIDLFLLYPVTYTDMQHKCKMLKTQKKKFFNKHANKTNDYNF